MKRYYVFEIECGKDMKLSDIAGYLSNYKYSRRLFEMGKIDVSSIYPKRIKELFDEHDLERFSYEYKLRENYAPTPIISNLNSNIWIWGNPSCHENLSAEAFNGVIEICQKLKSTMCSGFFIGFDEISWRGETETEGTYGYEMPKATIFQGSRYLSNSVIVTKDFCGKSNYQAYVSCESKYKDFDRVKQLVEFLGKVKHEEELFAPSNEIEREKWNENRLGKEKKGCEFKSLCMASLSKLPYTVIEPPYNPLRCEPYPKEKINIRKLEKQTLCFDGWETKSKDPHFRSTVTRKIIDGIEYKMWIDSLHGGHYLQLWFSCSSPMFELPVHSGYSANPIDEEQAVNFMKNAAFLREKFVEIMTN